MRLIINMILIIFTASKFFTDKYYSSRDRNENSKALIVCGIASYIEENNVLILQEFLNYYFVGLPIQVENQLPEELEVQKCLTNKVLQQISSIQFIDDVNLILEIFLYKFEKRFIRIKAFVELSSQLAINGKGKIDEANEMNKFNLEYHISELSCYEQLHYQKFIKLYKLNEPSISAPLNLIIQKASRNTNCKSRFLADELQKLNHKKSANLYHTFINSTIFGDYFSPIFENKHQRTSKAEYELFKYAKMSGEFDFDSNFYSKIIMRVYFYGYRAPVIKQNPSKGLELIHPYLKTLPESQIDIFYNFYKIFNLIKDKTPDNIPKENSFKLNYYLLQSAMGDDNFIAAFFLFTKYYILNDKSVNLEHLKIISKDLNSRYRHCLKRVFGEFNSKKKRDEDHRSLLPDCLKLFPPNLELLKNLEMPINIDEIIKYSNYEEENKFSLVYTVLDYMTGLRNYYQLFVSYETNKLHQNDIKTIAYYAYMGVNEKIIELYDMIKGKGNTQLEIFLELKSILNGSFELISNFCEKIIEKKVMIQNQVLTLEELCKIVLEKEYTNNHNPHALYLLIEHYETNVDTDFNDIKMFLENKFINYTNIWPLLYSYFKIEVIKTQFKFIPTPCLSAPML